MNAKINALLERKNASFSAFRAAFWAWGKNPCPETEAAYRAAQKGYRAAYAAEWKARQQAGQQDLDQKLVEAIFPGD
jgi:hypothetical protein